MAANATAVWRVRPSGNNNNGGGYDAGIASAGTDFSQQDAAQVTQSGGTVSTATTTLTDTGASFTSALIGNAIRVSGTGITSPFWTYITAVPTGTTLTLQTSPGTTGTSVTYSIGGGWANPFINPSNAAAPVQPGNIVYILGSGTPNPSSYTIDYPLVTSYDLSNANGTTGGPKSVFANDPNTPGYKAPPDTTGGMPTIKAHSDYIIAGGNDIDLRGLWCIANGASADGLLVCQRGRILGCVIDQNGFDIGVFPSNSTTQIFEGGEIFSSAGGSGGSNYAIQMITGCAVINSNIHDTKGPGIYVHSNGTVLNCIVAKCSGNGITQDDLAFNTTSTIINNTIDGNTGHGVSVLHTAGIAYLTLVNNIISNHTGGGDFGLIVGSGTTATNDSAKGLVDYNVYYNNTADLSAISYGSHDTHGGSNPYVGQSTENYTLA